MPSPEPRPSLEAENHTCPRNGCGQPARPSTQQSDRRGPLMTSRTVLYCPSGHSWAHNTDSG